MNTSQGAPDGSFRTVSAECEHGTCHLVQRRISLEASPATVGTALVRFKRSGEYQLSIGYAGVLFPPVLMTIIID